MARPSDRSAFLDATEHGGDSLRVPELDEVPERLGPLDLAVLPTNGLCIRPMNLAQVPRVRIGGLPQVDRRGRQRPT